MKRLFFCAVCLLATVTAVKAQKTEDSVKTVVNGLFIAMATSDSAGVINAFMQGGMLQTIIEKDGQTTVETEALADFAHVIAGLNRSDADEQIKYNTIKIDGPLAFVWAPYNFFFKGKFSHCGVDCFCVVRTAGGWKIQYIIDTRRKDGCKYK
ncbi:MAG TPA: hypothetical protein VHB48_13405 [Chitinophagaceae bacterium]|nr:hypothetical protein [Chitinophagaceae bacterium]